MILGLSHNAQWVLLSTLILGTAAGIIGCFAYWKRQSLMSDALSHAALPGVICGFAILGVKNLPVMIAGAAASALFGALLIHWIRSSSRVKEDAAMGIILSVFFGLGVMLLTFVNRMASQPERSGQLYLRSGGFHGEQGCMAYGGTGAACSVHFDDRLQGMEAFSVRCGVCQRIGAVEPLDEQSLYV